MKWVAISSPNGLGFVRTLHYYPSILGESQAGIKIARRNINDLRYADDAL